MRSGEVTATHIDRTWVRVTGWLTIGVGAATAIALMTVPFAIWNERENDEAWVDWFIAGSTVLITSQILGIILAVQPDDVALRFD